MASTKVAKNIKLYSQQYNTIKSWDLELNKEYFLEKITKTKVGYTCVTLNIDIKFRDDSDNIKNLSSAELKNKENNISFYSNKSLNDMIKKHKLAQCVLSLKLKML